MTRTEPFWTGEWWRFERYEITDDSIRPAKGAELKRYDPWETYREGLVSAGTPPPYQSLLALMQSLGVQFDDGSGLWSLADFLLSFPPLTAKQENLITAWCSRFGLLGILPHEAAFIELPRKFCPLVDKKRYWDARHIRIGTRWWNAGHWSGGKIPRIRLSSLPHAVEKQFLPRWSENYRVPTVLLVEPFVIKGLPAAELIDSFFPALEGTGDQFECPIPLSPEFWVAYSETAYDFLLTAGLFLNAVAALSSTEWVPPLVHWNWLLGTIATSVSFDSGVAQEQWVCPTLISSFARMALQDRFAGMRVLRCDSCGTLFVTDSYQARYCSIRCGWRHQKRRKRGSKTKRNKE